MDAASKNLSLDALFNLNGFEAKLTDGLEQRLLTCHTSAGKMSAIDQTEQSITRMVPIYLVTAITEMQKKTVPDLRRKRNMHAPVGRLCDELISRILEYCVHDECQHKKLSWNYTREDHDTKAHYRLYVPSAFSICTKWRFVAINTPSLWTKVSLPANQELFQLFRHRSRNMPLEVILRCAAETEDRSITNADDIREIAPRISILKIMAASEAEQQMDVEEFLKTRVGQHELSSLSTLTVFVETWDDDDYAFNLNAPAIHTLIAYNSQLCCPFVRLDCIINLSCTSWSAAAAEILDFLNAMPNLEKCSIWNYPDETPTETPVSAREVHLPKLEKLCIRNVDATEVIRLFSHLILSLHPELELRMLEVWGEPLIEDFFHFVGPYMASCNSLEIAQPDALKPDSFETEVEIPYLYKTYRGEGLRLTLLSEVGRRFEFDWIDWSVPAGDSGLQMLDILASYPSVLTRLDLEQKLPPVTNLIKALSLWSQIARIRVRVDEHDFENLLTALEDIPDIICPVLSILDCREVKFSSERMESFLGFRKDKGVPIHELVMTRGCVEGRTDDLVRQVSKLSLVEPEGSEDVEESGEPELDDEAGEV
ncbi:hypothetical protein SISNIDRAFT_484112 [Sistotremastrum niveocremeum HHB9708]|uniref:F-box domain-containing protein n=1 Tax=Sistotremastrum niveocremeum HHB9708 TaxID=1314777 RepID=A0A164WPW5_9AGAM|nr:hypothetical protein SISNIDRAFT_484112 [Sistotremastrum niveocremeum HHB9708]